MQCSTRTQPRALSFSFPLLLLLSLLLWVGQPRDANAGLTIMLDFSSTVTDIFNEETGAFNATPYGFTTMNQAQVEQAILDRVVDHFLSYPTASVDASSPLPEGSILDIDFEIGSFNSAPASGNSEWYYLAIGTGLSGTYATNSSIYGAACLDCIRDSAGTANKFGLSLGAIVGSIFSDHIVGSAGLASNDAERINLIAGTVSHEIGHTLSLVHPGAKSANPGASQWGLMGSVATSMPASQRVLDREFTYNNMSQLMGAIGVTSVPEPASLLLFVIGILIIWSLPRGVASSRHAQAGDALCPA